MVKFFKIEVSSYGIELGDIIEFNDESLQVLSIIKLRMNDNFVLVHGTGIALADME